MMGPDYGGGLANDRVHGHPPQPQPHPPPPGSEGGYQLDHERPDVTASPSLQNGGFLPPSRHPGSPAPSTQSDTRPSGERNRSKNRGRTSSGQLRICQKCGEQLTGKFVRALDGTFHLDCFKCRVSTLVLTYLLHASVYSIIAAATNTPLSYRIVARSLPPNSFLQMKKKGRANIRYARRIIFAG